MKQILKIIIFADGRIGQAKMFSENPTFIFSHKLASRLKEIQINSFSWFLKVHFGIIVNF